MVSTKGKPVRRPAKKPLKECGTRRNYPTSLHDAKLIVPPVKQSGFSGWVAGRKDQGTHCWNSFWDEKYKHENKLQQKRNYQYKQSRNDTSNKSNLQGGEDILAVVQETFSRCEI